MYGSIQSKQMDKKPLTGQKILGHRVGEFHLLKKELKLHGSQFWTYFKKLEEFKAI